MSEWVPPGLTYDGKPIIPVDELPGEPAMPPIRTGYPMRDQTDAIAAGFQAVASSVQRLADAVAAGTAPITPIAEMLTKIQADIQEMRQQALRRGRGDR